MPPRPRRLPGARKDARRGEERAPWVVPILIALVTFVAFLPALQGQFVSWDDQVNFLDNPHYRGLGANQLKWMWTTTWLGHYVPLSWMTLGLDYVLWGMNPTGYHLVNLLLHAANAVLVYVVARRLFRLAGVAQSSDIPAITIPAAFAALFFALHPLRVGSVAWITERRDVLSLLFYLTSVLCYLRAVAEPARFKRWYGLTLTTFVCALLAKATSVTLPAALLILNVYPLRRLGGRAGWGTKSALRVYLELAPLGALAVAAGILSIVALPPQPQLSLGGKLAVSTYSLIFYLWKTVAPLRLSPFYEMPANLNPAAAIYLASGVGTVVLAVIVWLARRRSPGITTACVAFAILMLPFLGVVQNGPQIVAQHYTYHAAPALALLIAAAFRWRTAYAVLLPAGALLLLLLALLSWKQTRVWQNSEALWSQVLQVDTTSSIAHNNFGVVLAEQGKPAEAIEHYVRAIALRPRYADPYNNLGFELAQQGDTALAIEQYRQALALKPSFAEAEINWGNALFGRRQFDEAIVHYRRAAEIQPDHAGAQFDWGLALELQGKLLEAVDHFTLAVRLDSGFSDAQRALTRATRAWQEQQARRRSP
jgi:tetratricopeptide (TPR) repeat protein